MTRRLLLPLITAALLIPLSGCDETGPMLSLDEGVAVAVDDAILAREQGDYDTATDLLYRALEAEPTNAVVRVELSTTLLQREGIDLFDIERIGQYLETAGMGRTAQPASARSSATCAYAGDPTAVQFDPTEYEGFDELVLSIEVLEEVTETLGGVLPAAVEDFALCGSVVDGELVYDQAGAIVDLRARGLTDEQAAQALAVGALARFVDAYVTVTEELADETAWYRLADGSIGICAADEEAARTKAEGAIQGIGEAILSLDTRAAILGAGATVAAEIVDTALSIYGELEQDITTYCEL